MTDPISTDLAPTKPISAPVFLPALTWILIQLLTLTLLAKGVQPWARSPEPVQEFALPVVLWINFAAAAMLVPWLGRDRRLVVFACCSAALFVQLSGILGEQPVRISVVASGSAVLWLVGLALVDNMLGALRSKLLLVALGSALVIGGACLSYLRIEFVGD